MLLCEKCAHGKVCATALKLPRYEREKIICCAEFLTQEGIAPQDALGVIDYLFRDLEISSDEDCARILYVIAERANELKMKCMEQQIK
jgi:hypothetical protein